MPPKKSDFSEPVTQRAVTVTPEIAWRTVPTANGGVAMVHQQAVIDDIEISHPNIQGSSYGSGFDCSGIVKDVVTTTLTDATPVSHPIVGAPLPVDVAVSAMRSGSRSRTPARPIRRRRGRSWCFPAKTASRAVE